MMLTVILKARTSADNAVYACVFYESYLCCAVLLMLCDEEWMKRYEAIFTFESVQLGLFVFSFESVQLVLFDIPRISVELAFFGQKQGVRLFGFCW